MTKDNIESIHHLTPLQVGLLFHSLSAPDSGMYLTQLSFQVEHDLDLAAWRSTWQLLLARHAILRTLFVWHQRRTPLQVVRQHVALPWLDLDWRDLAPSQQQQQLHAWLDHDRQQDFALDQAPLLRLAVIRLGAARSHVVLTCHHLLLDGWSLAVLLDEAWHTYQALRDGTAPALPPVRPFADYVAWLRQQDHRAAERFWRETLAGFDAPTPLGIAQPVAGPSIASAVHQHTLPASLSAALVEQARQWHVTLNTLLVGAWALLLGCYSGERRVLLGTTVAGRPPELAGVEQMVGLFINSLPLALELPAERRLRAWLSEVQAAQLARQPFEGTSLVDVQGWSGIARGQPLFHSLFVFENYPARFDSGVTNSRFPISHISSAETTHYALNFIVEPGERWLIKVVYDPSRFEESAILRMLGHYQTLLEQIVAHPDAPIRDIGVLTEDEIHTTLRSWNKTERENAEYLLLPSYLERHAKLNAAHTAVVFNDERLTYTQLNEQANQVAHYVRRLGIGPETLVGLCVERSLQSVVAIMGILKAGAAYVPLDPAYPKARLDFMIADAGITLLLAQSELMPALPPGLPVVLLDGDWEAIAQEPRSDGAWPIDANSLAYVMYTSGSTGKPKGVMIEHKGLTNLALAMIETFGLRPSSRVLQFSSLSFDASVFEMVGAISAGAQLHLLHRRALFPGPQFTQIVRDEEITFVVLPPSFLARLPVEPFPALETIVVAGEACPPDLVTHWAAEHGFFNAYGPTEATIWTTIAHGEAHDTVTTIGRPIANTRLYLLDEHLRPVPVGVVGQIYIGGIGLARGYLHRPKLTAERFVPDPFGAAPGGRLYQTGDLARYLPDGQIAFVGRVDDQVKVRGYRLELGEIQAVLRQHPHVGEAIVVARKNRLGDDRLAAYIVPSSNHLRTADLRAFLTLLLPPHMIPSTYTRLDALPLTANGKIDREALPAPDEFETDRTDLVAPRNAAEEAIAAIWSTMLAIDREHISAHDNFFDLGGHSLLIIQLQTRLEEAFKQTIPIVELFRHPTVTMLGDYLTRDTDKLPPSHESRERAAARRASRLRLRHAK